MTGQIITVYIQHIHYSNLWVSVVYIIVTWVNIVKNNVNIFSTAGRDLTYQSEAGGSYSRICTDTHNSRILSCSCKVDFLWKSSLKSEMQISSIATIMMIAVSYLYRCLSVCNTVQVSNCVNMCYFCLLLDQLKFDEKKSSALI